MFYTFYTTGREYRCEYNRYRTSYVSLFTWLRHTCLAFVMSSAIDCVVNENRASETQGRCVKIVDFIVIYGFVMLCKKEIMYVLSWWTLLSVLFLYLFPSLLHNSENNTKITLSWVLKQSVTRVHTLFSIYLSAIILFADTFGNKTPFKMAHRISPAITTLWEIVWCQRYESDANTEKSIFKR